MKEHPILFSGSMIRALLEGRKTQTRRIVKPVRGYEHNNICRPDLAKDSDTVWWHGESERVGCLQKCPYGTIGDRLWVRETFKASYVPHPPDGHYWMSYLADGTAEEFDGSEVYMGRIKPGKTYPSIHMPRWASRITLEITDIRVQRLQEITEEDAVKEGVVPFPKDPEGDCWTDGKYLTAFQHTWGEINGWPGQKNDEKDWQSNPWVWALTFKRVMP